MGIIEDVFQMEGKECKDQERLKSVWEKIDARARKVLQHGIGNFVCASGSGRERFVAAAKNSTGEKGSKNINETPQGTWLRDAQKRSLWLLLRSAFGWKIDKVGPQIVCKDQSLLP